MIFNKDEYKDEYECIDWIDHLDDELIVGQILNSNLTGYYYFNPSPEIVLECGNLIRLGEKLSELNKDI